MAMHERAEALERDRRRMLLGFLVAWIAWQGGEIWTQVADGPGWVTGTVAVVTAVGALAWVVFMFRMTRLQRRLRQEPKLAHQMDDERIREIRRRSLETGFWVLLVVLIAGRLAAFLGWTDLAVFTQIGLLIGIAAPIAVFLVLDGSAHEEDA